MQIPWPERLCGLVKILLIVVGSMLVFTLALADAKAPLTYQTIWLTGHRVCKKCSYRLVPPQGGQQALVELTNKKGQTGLYPLNEVLGIDSHPWLNRFAFGAARGNGLAGKIIVPEAFSQP